MAEDVAESDAVGELELIFSGRRMMLAPSEPFVVGRGTRVDLDLAHPNVSRKHLVLETADTSWTLTDRSRNGTFVDGRRISHLQIDEPTTVQIGSPADGVSIDLLPHAGKPRSTRPTDVVDQGRPSFVHHVGQPRTTIGRSPDNDVILDDLLVSRRHAELLQGPEGWRLVDLGSPNGTFVNGCRINEAWITSTDVIGIGRNLFRLDGGDLVAFVEDGGNTFEVDGITVVTPKGKTLLQSVGFTLPEKSLLAVIGPSGAGKSTLLNALTGARPADTGEIRYAERDLYREYDELRHRIALVPQEDVLHTQLTVRQALTYAARLRFPADTTRGDRRRRVDEVIAELGLSAHADQRIHSLSGGQRKRTSVALELLTKPSLLFLDEPTSGLDPGMDRSVMRTLRTLADDGRTVVVVTHNVSNLDACDKLLLLAPGGWVAYYGSPADALRYFGQKDFTDVFLLLEQAPGEHWAQRFRRSPDYRRTMPNIDRRPASGPATPPPSSAPRQQSALTQFWVLLRRYLAVIASDRPYVVFLAALPVVLSLLAHAVPGSVGLSVIAARPTYDPQPRQLLLVLIISAALMGAATAMRELVKERPIYCRERATGLSVGAYLASKIVVLGVVTGLQAALLTTLALLGRADPDEALILSSGHAEVLLAVVAVTITSMLTGLLISAVIDNADRGMPLLVLVIMVQLVLCGGMFAVQGRPVLEQVSWLVPARWGFAMAAATTDIGELATGAEDPTWRHQTGVWLADSVLLVAIALVLTAFLIMRLRRLDPQRRNTRG